MSRHAGNTLLSAIDGLAFAGESRSIGGRVAIADLARLGDALTTTDGSLECRVDGECDGDGKLWLNLGVSGQLDLRCQRCLATLVFPLDVVSRLLLVPSGQPWPDEELTEDGFDAIPAEKEMELLPLIEEEVLLALPIAPRHEACEAPVPVAEELESSPFAVLAQLKKGV
jgi:uncharacterized protein